MKLPDFLQHPELNQLRAQMGTEHFGSFELFDPERQLTYAEREALEQGMISIHGQALRVLKDKTLAYKNTRVWLQQDQDFHLAYCPAVQSLRHRATELTVGTGNTQTPKDGGVCLECLAVLQYQGVDARRLRRAEFSDQIREQFSLDGFKDTYPFYPII